MFYISLALIAWLVALWVVDWRRWRELLVYGLVGSIIAATENEFGYLLGLWRYRDTGPLADHHAISMVISLSAAPLFAMAFAQALRPGRPPPWLRVAGTTAVAMVPEVIGLYTGNIVHQRFWSPPVSVVAYLPTWLLIWWLHRQLQPIRG